MDWIGVPEKSPEEAWEMLKTASAERDLFDFKTVSYPGLRRTGASTFLLDRTMGLD